MSQLNMQTISFIANTHPTMSFMSVIIILAAGIMDR